MPDAIAPATPAALAPAATGDLSPLLALAVEKNLDVEKLERLVGLHERALERDARAQFFEAQAEFQRLCPPIRKVAAARTSPEGGKVLYTFAPLDEIARTINPFLARFGLSYSWDSTVTEDDKGATLTCVCTVRHKAGHFITATFRCPVAGTNMMSGAQKAASALTYARRQSLVQALGLTTTDDDDDGRDTGASDDAVVTEEQAANLGALIDDVGADKAKFLAFFKVASIAAIPASRFTEAVRMLEAKRKAGAK